MKAYSICLLISAILCVNGAMANSYDPTEDVDQFNERLARTAPDMIYLGNYDRKGWYAFNDVVTLPIARGNCVNMGMKLAIIDSQAELDFIANAITGPQYHTDGNFLCRPSSFHWSTGLRELSPDLKIVQGQYNLRLVKASRGLLSENGVGEYPYLCFISLGSRESKALRDTVVIEDGTGIEMSEISEFVDNEILSKQTVLALTYLGKYGNKSFYYDNALVHWPTAKGNCEKMGMTFARFDSQNELEWILSVVPDNQNGDIWTDGESNHGSQYWYWVSNGNNLNHEMTNLDPTWGLAIRISQRSLQLRSKTFSAKENFIDSTGTQPIIIRVWI